MSAGPPMRTTEVGASSRLATTVSSVSSVSSSMPSSLAAWEGAGRPQWRPVDTSRLWTIPEGPAVDADVIVVGAGLAGLVATAELADAGRRVLLLDQESEANLGGQAFWSLGGLFLVDSPEQRRLGIRDSVELAWQDWLGTAGFDRLADPD